MSFEEIYKEVRGIVLRCRKDYYLHLWELSDWEQEGMLILHQLLTQHPELEEEKSRLYVYYKTKFRNHILDLLRKQGSQKRTLDRQPYEEVGAIAHKLCLREMYIDELVILRSRLSDYQSQLSPAQQESYARLLGDERFKGRKELLRELSVYLSDYRPGS